MVTHQVNLVEALAGCGKTRVIPRLLKKVRDARRSSIRLRRRTEKYADEAARLATQQMRLFQQPA